MELKFKKLDYVVLDDEYREVEKESEGSLPKRATDGSAGYDLIATRITQELDEAGKVMLVYHTDIAVEIPKGAVGLLLMRSSVSKRSITLANAVGVIDSDYRGEIMLKFKITTDALPSVYQVGDAVGQLVIVPIITPEPVFVDELSATVRGNGGYGSTDANADNNQNENEHTTKESVEVDTDTQEVGAVASI